MNKITKTDKKIIALSFGSIIVGTLLLGFGGNLHALFAMLGLVMIVIASTVLLWASPW
jgi:hypothetical protein